MEPHVRWERQLQDYVKQQLTTLGANDREDLSVCCSCSNHLGWLAVAVGLHLGGYGKLPQDAAS